MRGTSSTMNPAKCAPHGSMLAPLVGLVALVAAACAGPARQAPIVPRKISVILPDDPLAVKFRHDTALLPVSSGSETRLQNGIRILQLRRAGSGLVDVSLMVRYPLTENAALAGVTANAVARETREVAGVTLGQRSAELGSALGVQTGLGATWFTFRVLKTDALQAAKLLNRMIDLPLSDADGIREARRRYRLIQVTNLAQADYLANRRLLQTMYGADDPLARIWLDADAVAAIDTDAVTAFQRRWYRPEHMVLIVAGDLVAGFIDGLKKFAGRQPVQGVPPLQPLLFHPPLLERPRLVIVDRPKAAQVEVRLGLPGPDIHAPDYPAMRVLSELLGGGSAGRLFKDLRARQGLTYDVSAQLWRQGLLVVSMAMAHEKFAAALSALLQHLQALRATAPSVRELQQVKYRLAARLALAGENTDALEEMGIGLGRSGLPATFAGSLQAGIAAVTVADIQRVIDRYLTARASIVAVGDKRVLRESVARFLPELAAWKNR